MFDYEELCQACSKYLERNRTVEVLRRAAIALEVEHEEIVTGDVQLHTSASREGFEETLLYDLLYWFATCTMQESNAAGNLKESAAQWFDYLATLLRSRRHRLASLCSNGASSTGQWGSLARTVLLRERRSVDYWLEDWT